ESIQLLVVPRGGDRLALVQVFFQDDKGRKLPPYRNYLLVSRQGRANKNSKTPGRYCSFVYENEPIGYATQKGGVMPPDLFDLRDRGDDEIGAEIMQGWLESYPRDIIDQLLQDHGKEVA